MNVVFHVNTNYFVMQTNLKKYDRQNIKAYERKDAE